MKFLLILTIFTAAPAYAASHAKSAWARALEDGANNPDGPLSRQQIWSDFCDRDLDLLAGQMTENRATVTKLSRTIGYAQMNVRGQIMRVFLNLNDVQGFPGKTWEERRVHVGSQILVEWKAWRSTAVKISTGRKGSAPAKIVEIASDGMLFLEADLSSDPQFFGPRVPGDEHLMLAAKPEQVHDLGKRSYADMNLQVGTIVWVKWNPENNDVESVVP
jgi:hypothetical protein